ncbi:DUF4210 domain-containing protein [Pseudozyma hubeiensis]|nr:DUF4210 domain-containing protein [Pseudozyma hubeiensis]
MSFYSAFPTSPLSRSALISEASVEPQASPDAQSKRPKVYGKVSSPLGLGSASRRFSDTKSFDDDFMEIAPMNSLSASRGVYSAAPSSRHVSGPARLMRNPFAPSRSATSNNLFDDSYDANAVSPPMPSSSFTRSVNARRRSSGFSSIFASSPTPNFGSLVGSFQESLLRGRMSMPASKPLIFDAEIGVLGMGRCKPSLRCPPHVHVQFPAHFYDFHAMDAPSSSSPSAGSTAALGSPYVGTIDLDAHYHNTLLAERLQALSSGNIDEIERVELPAFPGYAVPPKGQIQLIVKYPDLNAVKLFLVPYDLTDMQPGTKTFVRQKTVARPSSVNDDAAPKTDQDGQPSNARTTPSKEALRFAIHLQFCCPPAKAHHHDNRQAGFDGSESHCFRPRNQTARDTAKQNAKGRAPKSPRIYLHKSIRLVFGARALDSSEKLIDHIDTPGQGAQRFSTYFGPEEEWEQLRHHVKAARCSAERFRSLSLADSSSSSPELAASNLPSTRNGLGIAIQSTDSRPARSNANDGRHTHTSVMPLNSDPNGERWQSNGSFAQQSEIDPASETSAQLRSATSWGLSSRESSFGVPAQHWPQSANHGQQDVHQLARSLAASRLTEALASNGDAAIMANEPAAQTPHLYPMSQSANRSTDLDSAGGMQQVHPAVLAAARSLRLRSASAASLSEARVQTISALGRVEEADSEAKQINSLSADSPVSRRSSKLSTTMANDRPSLIRKLSEQFARSHTPSPTSSPQLNPTMPVRQAIEEPVELAVDDPDGVGGYNPRVTPDTLVITCSQQSSRSIR